MKVLVLFNTEIKAWLVNEPLELVEEFIRNGYPDLQAGYADGTIKAQVIDIPDEDAFRADLYEVVGDLIVRKEEQ